VTIDVRKAAEAALAAALEAATLVMQVYAAPFEVEFKIADDPVTRADKEANALLCERLARALPVPIVAEESDPATYAGFGASDAAWFVDPLDGTREFVARNGQFAVMVGLAQGGRATVGVVVAPAWDRAFLGIVGVGAWEILGAGTGTGTGTGTATGTGSGTAERSPIRVSTQESPASARIVVSRSRVPAQVAGIVASLGMPAPRPHGSSGLKGALVATAEADVYLQPGPAGMRWDACATDALVHAAGGRLTQADGTDFDYRSGQIENRRGMIATNGRLHDVILRAIAADRAP
jgi:3'(2'), 5'-bisphosphate nucleotidase